MSVALSIFDSIRSEEDIDNLLAQRATENLHLEFKTKRNTTSPDLICGLDVNISKAISGFANSEGGVLVVGIDAPSQGTVSKQPVSALSQLEVNANGYVSRATSFVVEGVLIKKVFSNPSRDEGYLIIYIPQSDLAPHRSQKDSKYYLRSGESFVPMEHYQVADIFGRRQKPYLIPFISIKGDINSVGKVVAILGIKNTGRAMAKFPYIKIKNQAGFGFNAYGISGNGQWGLPTFPGATSYTEYRGGVNDVIQCLMELPVTKLEQTFQLTPASGNIVSGSAQLQLTGSIAAEEFPLKNWVIDIDIALLNPLVQNPRGTQALVIYGSIV